MLRYIGDCAKRAGDLDTLRADPDPISHEKADIIDTELAEIFGEYMACPYNAYVFRLYLQAKKILSTGLWPWDGQLDRQDICLVEVVEALKEGHDLQQQANAMIPIKMLFAMKGENGR